jgi:hypothetical protein
MKQRNWIKSWALISVLVLLGLAAGCGKWQAKKLGISAPEYRVRVDKDVMVAMRDGVELAADIYFPEGVEKAPVILIRTPYGKDMQRAMSLRGGPSNEMLLAQRGYVVIVQDVRGRYGSGGDFYPFIKDGDDGQDMIKWIEAQAWYEGKLGTYGGSYLGTTQWFESPGMDLSAMHLTVTSPNLKEVLYTGGELHLMTVYFWSMIMGEHKADVGTAAKIATDLDKYISTLPLDQADDAAGRDVIYFDQALDPTEIWKIYEGVNFENRYREVSAPAVFVAGWYDMFEGPQLKDFGRLLNEGAGNAKDSVLIVGPWGHGSGGDKSVDYGPEADMKKALGPAHLLAWFDYWLKGIDNGVKDWPRVKIFVMGDNVWRDENEWPLKRAQYTSYYLHSGGKANTAKGDGVLSLEAPAGDEAEDRFSYDPMNPVPTLGGNNLGLNLGAYNQAKVEARQDVLCYTTEVLKEDVEVTGPISGELWAASDAVDTDFTMKLVDVYPDGKAVNIQDGIVRAMYRDNDPAHPTPLKPGAVEQYQIDLWASSNVFKAGHRIRVEVSSSNFPRFNRNLNTGEAPAGAARPVIARQTIYHDPGRDSRIILPVIP